MMEVPTIWAGSLQSLDYVLEASVKVAEMRASRGSDPFELPPIYEVKDGVAVVSVSGPLIMGSAGFFRLFGVMGYDDIREGLMGAVSAKGVKSIMMHINSPGGHAQGVEDLSAFARSMRALKPMVTFTDATMASAAYWLGSSANKILAARTAIVGSIGAVTVHSERSRMLDREGITPTVVRSGKYKMLANSVEPLTEEAKAQLQSQVDDLNDMFEATVAQNLGVSQKLVHDKMGQGREFLGARAQEAGLVHGIATFDEAFAVAKLLGSR